MEKNENTAVEQNTKEAPIAIVDNPIEDISQLDTVQEEENGSIVLLYPEEYVKQIIHEMAEIIKERFKGKENVIFLEVLNGAKPLADQLKIDLDIQNPDSNEIEDGFYAYVDQIHPSSYRNGMEQDELLIKKDMKFDPKGKDVLIVEDVIDSYKTMSELKDMLIERGARSVTVAVLCNKRDKEDADISGFMIDKKHWLVGCGLGTAVEGQKDEIYREINNQKYALGVFIPK
jgi:hypoxanthine phosphoribosyltransferase